MNTELQFYKIKDFSLPDNYLDMYSPKIIIEGLDFMDITDANEIFDILKSCKENRIYLAQVADEKRKRLEFVNRFAIPRGLDKKEYKKIIVDTQTKINELKERIRLLDPDDRMFVEMELDDYIEKKAKINKIIDFHEGYGEMNIQKAKEFPVEQLLEFKGGFCNCPFHGPEKTNSAKLYKDRNKIHCFGCGIDADSIDIYQKLNGVDFNTAVKSLSK